MAVKLSPLFNNDGSQIDANGIPRSGGKLFLYSAGTTSKITSYRDSAGSVAHTNPIVLDANGLPPAPIWLSEGSTYKFVLAPPADTDPPVSAILTIDNITAINDVAAATGTEWTASGMAPTYVSTTSFTVDGDQTSILEVNRRLKLTVNAGTVFATSTKTAFASSVTTLSVELDSGSLDIGLSAFSYGILSTGNTSLPFVSRDQQCGRLTRVSATQIRLDPQDGNTIWVNIGGIWRRRTIPSAGVTAANTSVHVDGSVTNLGPDHLYYVYLWDNAGTLTMDFSDTAPAVDATSGLKIKAGAATRLLIGMAHTNGSSQFDLALSWYRRRGIKRSGALTTSPTTSSTSAIELHTDIRATFLSWAEEAIVAQFTGNGQHNTAAHAFTTSITLDGTSTVIASMSMNTGVANNAWNLSFGGQHDGLTDGYHYLTIAISVSNAAGTGQWSTGKLFVETHG